MDERKMNNIEKWQYVLPIIQEIIPCDVSIGLTNRNKYLLYLRGKKIDLHIKVNDPIKQESAIYKAMMEERRVEKRIDKKVYGQAYFVSAIPIYDHGNNIIGAVSIATPVETQDSVINMSMELSNAISIIASATQEINAQTQEITAECKELVELSNDSGRRVIKTDTIIKVIKDIFGQIKLLGINAAIESARVGEQGRGFSIVADEVRKLAECSNQSIKQISEIIKGIQSDSEFNQSKLRSIEENMSRIAINVANMEESIQTTEVMASQLENIAEDLEI